MQSDKQPPQQNDDNQIKTGLIDPTTVNDPIKSKFTIAPWHIFLAIVILLIAGLLISTKFSGLLSSQTSKTPTPKASASTATTQPLDHIPQQSTSNNNWSSSINPAAIPLGDGKVSSTPEVGYVDSCTQTFKGGGATGKTPWINQTNGTWDSLSKPAVQGNVSWPQAQYAVSISGNNRLITSNDLPSGQTTGIFPIMKSDPVYQYDANPNHIAAQSISYTLPLNPTAATLPSCTGLGPIGILNDGVVLFNALDAAGRDAVAHEVQDACNGHPDGSNEYHYHEIPSCILKNAKASSTLVGYALDGYGIYVERNSKGQLPTNANLDACHGRTSPVMWNGKLTDIYHYDATLEYPYTIGCFHATPVTNANANKPKPPLQP